MPSCGLSSSEKIAMAAQLNLPFGESSYFCMRNPTRPRISGTSKTRA